MGKFPTSINRSIFNRFTFFWWNRIWVIISNRPIRSVRRNSIIDFSVIYTAVFSDIFLDRSRNFDSSITNIKQNSNNDTLFERERFSAFDDIKGNIVRILFHLYLLINVEKLCIFFRVVWRYEYQLYFTLLILAVYTKFLLANFTLQVYFTLKSHFTLFDQSNQSKLLYTNFLTNQREELV